MLDQVLKEVFTKSLVYSNEKVEVIICGVSIYKVEGYLNFEVIALLLIQSRILKGSLHCLSQMKAKNNQRDWSLFFLIDEILYSLFYVFRTFIGLLLCDFYHPFLCIHHCKIKDEGYETMSSLPQECKSHYRIAMGTIACLSDDRSLEELRTFQAHVFSWTHNGKWWQYSSNSQFDAYLWGKILSFKKDH